MVVSLWGLSGGIVWTYSLKCFRTGQVFYVFQAVFRCARAWGSVRHFRAGVVKLADTPDLGSGAARRGGSSPSPRTIPGRCARFCAKGCRFGTDARQDNFIIRRSSLKTSGAGFQPVRQPRAMC